MSDPYYLRPRPHRVSKEFDREINALAAKYRQKIAKMRRKDMRDDVREHIIRAFLRMHIECMLGERISQP